ncbi:unnamed protein product [Ilex paraguariensis]|uniref:Uncharacterized protein n=1 Tax=Ilex paraguariensis TaxID=185542 RepID=A0ABC8UIC4_9AQUA
MDDMNTPTTPNPPLRRRKSIATSVMVATKHSLPTKTQHHTFSFPSSTTTTAATLSSSSPTLSFQSFPNVDFDLPSIKPISYTSLKDLLPSMAVQSPTAQPQAQSNISIRNRLVKQAAWAYLQPMSVSPDSAGDSFLHRLWVRFSGGDFLKNPCSALFSFIDRHISNPRRPSPKPNPISRSATVSSSRPRGPTSSPCLSRRTPPEIVSFTACGSDSPAETFLRIHALLYLASLIATSFGLLPGFLIGCSERFGFGAPNSGGDIDGNGKIDSNGNRY